MKISSLVKRTIIQSVSVLILASLVQTDAFARGGRGGGGGARSPLLRDGLLAPEMVNLPGRRLSSLRAANRGFDDMVTKLAITI